MKQYFQNNRLNSPEQKLLIPIFMLELQEDYDAFLLKFEEGDYATCLDYLHKIKGSSLTFGIQELAENIQNLHSLTILGNYVSVRASILNTNKLIAVLKEQAASYN